MDAAHFFLPIGGRVVDRITGTEFAGWQEHVFRLADRFRWSREDVLDLPAMERIFYIHRLDVEQMRRKNDLRKDGSHGEGGATGPGE